MADLVLAMPKTAETPRAYGEVPESVITGGLANFGGFQSRFEYNAQLQSSLVAGIAVGILSINPQLISLIANQFYPVGYGLFLTEAPTDPTLSYSVWSNEFLYFATQVKDLTASPEARGLSRYNLRFRIQTTEATFGSKVLAQYSIVGNTIIRNTLSLASFITDMSQQTNIVQFMAPMDLTLGTAYAIEALVAPAVGTAETLTMTLQVGQ